MPITPRSIYTLTLCLLLASQGSQHVLAADPPAATQPSAPVPPAAKPPAPAAAAPPPTAPSLIAGPKQPANIRFQFDSIPYPDVLRFFAQIAQKPIIGDIPIEGTLTYFESEPATYNEAFETLNTILAMRGFTLMESPRFLELVPLRDVTKRPLKILDGLDENKELPPGEIVTVVLPLKYLNADTAARSLAPMVSTFGSVTAMAKGRGVIITDRVSNIKRLHSFVGKIDIDNLAEQRFKTFRLKSASAREVAAILTNLYAAISRTQTRIVQQPGQQPTAAEPPPAIAIAFDERTNTLMVTGSGDQLTSVEALITSLDMPLDGPDQISSSIRIFALKSARAEDLALTIRQTIQTQQAAVANVNPGTRTPAGKPAMETRIVADASTNRLVVSAPADQMNAIENLVKQLDQATTEAGSFRVFKLKSADAQQLANVVAAAVTDRDAKGAIVQKLRVNADARTNALIIAGPAGDIARAASVIEELDHSPDKETREVHVVTLKAGDAAALSAALTRLFAQQQQQPGVKTTGTALRVEADAATNSLMISAAPGDWSIIEGILNQLNDGAVPAMVGSTRIIPLKFAKASEAVASLREVYAARAKPADKRSVPVLISGSDRANSILVTAAAEDQETIAQLLASIDVANSEKVDAVRIVRLQAADAAALATTLRAMLPPPKPGTQPVLVTADPRTNSVLLRAPEAEQAMLEEMVSKLDLATQQDARETRIINLTHTQGSTLAPILQQLFVQRAAIVNAGKPGQPQGASPDEAVIIAPAPGDHAIIVDAPKRKMTQVVQLAESLDKPADQVQSLAQFQSRVYQLTNSRANEVAPSLTRLFAQLPQPPRPPGVQVMPEPAPRFEADVATNQLLIAATGNQFVQIEALIKKLESSSTLTSQTITVSLKHATAADVAPAIAAMLTDVSPAGRNVPNATAAMQAKVAAIPATNALVLQGPPEKLAMAQQIIASLDVEQSSLRMPTIQVVNLKAAQAPTLAASVNASLALQAGPVRPGQRAPDPSENVTVTAETNSNSVLVRGPADKLPSVIEMIKKLDDQSSMVGSSVRIYKLANASATDLAPLLSTMLNDPGVNPLAPRPAGARSTVPPTLVSPLPAANSLVVQGSGDRLNLADELIKSFDVAQAAVGSSTIQIVNLKNAQAVTLAQAINVALQDPPPNPGQPPVKTDPTLRVIVTPEVNSNSVLVKGPSDKVAAVLEMIIKLDQNATTNANTQVRVFPLKQGQAVPLAANLDRLFRSIITAQAAGRGAAAPPPPPFTITADDRTNSLVVSTTPAHFAIVESLLQSLDQAPVKSTQNVHYIWLENAGAKEVLEKIDAMYRDRKGPDKPVVQADTMSNAVTVICKDEDFAMIEQVVAKIDELSKDNSRHVKVVPVSQIQAETLAQVLRNIYPQISGKQVILSGKAALPPTDPLQGPTTTQPIILRSLLTTSVVHVGVALADGAEATTQPAAAGPEVKGEAADSGPVTIAVDAASNALIISATKQELADIETLITQLVSTTGRGDAEFRIFKIAQADPDSIAQTLDELYNPKAPALKPGQDPKTLPPLPPPTITVVADVRTRNLIVRAKPTDFPVIQSLVEQLDKSSTTLSELRVFTLKNSDATETAANLKEIFKLSVATPAAPVPPGQPGAVPHEATPQEKRAARLRQVMDVRGGGKAGGKQNDASAVSVSANKATNSVVVSAPAEVMEMVTQIVQEIDQSGALASSIAVRIYPVKNAAPAALAVNIREVFAQQGGGPGAAALNVGPREPMSISADPVGRVLVVATTIARHELIAKVIEEIDQAQAKATEATSVVVYTLKNANAATIAPALSSTLTDPTAGTPTPGQRGGAGASPMSIRITADPSSNSLVIRASEDDHKRIVNLLAQLDANPYDQSPVQIIQLQNADAAVLAQTLTRVFIPGGPVAPGQPGRGQSGKPTAIIEFDRAAKTVMVRADEKTFQAIKELATKLDVNAASGQVTSVVIPLKHSQANTMAAALTPSFQVPRTRVFSIDDYVTITAEPLSNSVVVTASAANMARVTALVEKLDTPEAQASKAQFVILKNARATDLAIVLQRVAATSAATPGKRAQQGVTVSADQGSNAVVFAGPPTDIEPLVKMAQQLDEAATSSTANVYVLPLKNGDATTTAAMVRDLYTQQVAAAARAKTPVEPMAVSADQRANALIVATSKPMYEQVAAWVKELEDMKPAKGSLRIINLKSADPVEVDKAIKGMMNPAGAPKPGAPRMPGAPVSGGDIQTTVLPQQRSIIVSASDEDFTQIQELVNKLDATALETKMQVKLFQLKHASNVRVAQALTEMGRAANPPGKPINPDEQFTASAIPQTDTLVISAPQRKLEELGLLIAQLDKPEMATELSFRVFVLKHATPTKILPTLQQLLAQIQRTRPNDPINASADERTRSIIITARGPVFEQVAEIIAKLDQPPAFEQAQVVIIPLRKADATRLAVLLTEMLRPLPDGQVTPEAKALQEQVRLLRIKGVSDGTIREAVELDLTKPIKINADAAAQGSNSLVVTSTPENIKAMEMLVAALDTVPVIEGVKVRVVHLTNADAVSVQAVLHQVFTQGKTLNQKTGSPAPGKAEPDSLAGKALVSPVSISADPRTNSLIIAGGEESLALADLVVADLDRTTGQIVTDVRLFKLKHVDPTKIMPMLLSVFAESAPAAGTEGVRTQVTRLRTVLEPGREGLNATTKPSTSVSDVAKARPALTIQADASTRTLIVAARSDVMPLIADVVQTLDMPGVAEMNAVRIFPLANADATRLKGVIDSMYAGPAAAQIKPEDRPTVAVDTRTNALVIAASDKTFAVVDAMLRQLDLKNAVDLKDVKLIALTNTEATSLARTLQQMMDARVSRQTALGAKDAESVRVVVLADPRSNSLMVSGSPEGFELVKALAAQLDTAKPATGSEVQLIPLKSANAGSLAQTLSRMFEQRYTAAASVPGGAGQALRPIILPDLRTNSLMVAASPDDTRVLMGLLKQLDVELAGASIQLTIVPLKHNDAASIAPMIRTIFQARMASLLAPGQAANPSDHVDVSYDQLTNSLVISATKENLELIKGLLEKVDVQPPSVTGVVKLYTLKNSDAQRVATMLQTLISQGLYKPGAAIAGANASAAAREKVSVAVDLRTNVLIISASKENFAVIDEIIKGVDDSQDMAANGDIRLFTLIRSDATRMGPMLTQFFNSKRQAEQAAGGSGRSLPVTIIPDSRTNSLLVAGSRESFAAIEVMIKKLDGDQAGALNEFKVFYLKNAAASGLQPTIQQLFDQRALKDENKNNKVTIVADPRVNALVMSASPEDIELAAALVKRLDIEPDAPGSKVQVYPLAKADAVQVANTLRSLFSQTGGGTPGATSAAPGQNGQPAPGSVAPIVISADPRLNAVIASGNQGDLDRISQLIAELDGDANSRPTEIRVFPLKNADAGELSALLTTAINKKAGGAAGVPVAPGATSPAVLQFLTRTADGKNVISTGLTDGITITPDRRTNSIVISAPAENMELLDNLVRSMDTGSPQAAQIRVFRLVNADARQMADVLSQIFKLTGGANARAFSYTLVSTDEAITQPAGPTTQPVAKTVTIGSAEQYALTVTVDVRTNSLLIGGARQHVDLCSDIIRDLDSSPAQERMTELYRLKNSQAVDVQTALRAFLDQERTRLVATLGADKVGAAQRLLEREVAVVAEKMTNTLLISASPRYFEVITKMVRDLDLPQPQVLIQVVLAEVTLDDSDSLGFEWTYKKGIGNYNVKTGTDLGVAGDLLTNGGYSVAVTGGDISMLLHALATKGKLEVLSRPQVMASDNQQAEIKIGQRVPIITSSRSSDVTSTTASTFNTISYQDVGILLTVTPRINDDGFIRLEVAPEVSSVATTSVQISKDVNAVVINNRSAKTTVSVQDGHTIVLGGLITTKNDEREKKVPIIGDIPLLGSLFKSTRKIKERTELLIIMTPRVIQNQARADVVTDIQTDRMKKVKETDSIETMRSDFLRLNQPTTQPAETKKKEKEKKDRVESDDEGTH